MLWTFRTYPSFLPCQTSHKSFTRSEKGAKCLSYLSRRVAQETIPFITPLHYLSTTRPCNRQARHSQRRVLDTKMNTLHPTRTALTRTNLRKSIKRIACSSHQILSSHIRRLGTLALPWCSMMSQWRSLMMKLLTRTKHRSLIKITMIKISMKWPQLILIRPSSFSSSRDAVSNLWTVSLKWTKTIIKAVYES